MNYKKKVKQPTYSILGFYLQTDVLKHTSFPTKPQLFLSY
jgi:hypothetical protein